MPKISKYEQRAAQKRQAERAGVAFHDPAKPEKAFLSPQENAKAEENKQKPAPDAPGTKRVIFMSRNDASGYPYRSSDAIISITDTHAEPPTFFRKPDDVEVLHRGFHDHVSIRSEAQGDRWCRIEDGEAIVDFVLKHKDAPTIVVHCNMGQSRSKAAALAIAECTGRLVKCYNRNGDLVAYRNDGDDGNRRVWSCIMHAHMDREETESDA
jgi:protein-tyrosine phosphatase